MPTISIFIRKNDLPIWQSIEGKSEWLHQRLTGEVFTMVPGDAKKITEEMTTKSKPLTQVVYSEGGEPTAMVGRLPDNTIGFRADSDGLKFCKHGSDPKFCKYAKPGKPCK